MHSSLSRYLNEKYKDLLTLAFEPKVERKTKRERKKSLLLCPLHAITSPYHEVSRKILSFVHQNLYSDSNT